jgi:hypothetical protein
MSDWQGQLLRATFFPAEFVSPQSLNIWEAFGIAELEGDEFKPRDRLRRLTGNIDESRSAEIQIQPERIDFFIGVRVPENAPPIQSFGLIDPTADLFEEKVLRWLPSSPKLVRMAYGGVALRPTTDTKTGYSEISKLEPALQLPENEEFSDFMLQLNRPRNISQPKAMRINRLLKWSVLRFQVFAIHADTLTGKTQHQVEAGAHYVRMELDINTAPLTDGSAFENSENVPIFRELVSTYRTILERGVSS